MSKPPSVTVALPKLMAGTVLVVRMIPNAPSLIGVGYNPVWFSEGINKRTSQVLKEMLAPLGPPSRPTPLPGPAGKLRAGGGVASITGSRKLR